MQWVFPVGDNFICAMGNHIALSIKHSFSTIGFSDGILIVYLTIELVTVFLTSLQQQGMHKS